MLSAESVRRIALALPEATEAPHHRFASFRIRGRIFATLPPDGDYLHVFVDEPQREIMIRTKPAAYEKLWWGKKVVGLRCRLSVAESGDIEHLLHSAWLRKAPKNLRG